MAAPRRSSTSAASPRLRATCQPNRSRRSRRVRPTRRTPASGLCQLSLKPNEKPAFAGFLFDFCFLVDDVFARPGVVLLHLVLVGRGALVLGGSVEVAGAGRGFEFDFLALRRGSRILDIAALAHIFEQIGDPQLL